MAAWRQRARHHSLARARFTGETVAAVPDTVRDLTGEGGKRVRFARILAIHAHFLAQRRTPSRPHLRGPPWSQW